MNIEYAKHIVADTQLALFFSTLSPPIYLFTPTFPLHYPCRYRS